MGINGTDVTHKITEPLGVTDLDNKLLTKQTFAILTECSLCLMGRDLVSSLGLSITFDLQGSMTAKSVRICGD